MAMRSLALVAAVSALLVVGGAGDSHAQVPSTMGGFDIQPWRPSPGPRDLVIIPQSQPLRNKSVSIGAYFSFSLDPLTLLTSNGSSNSVAADLITGQLEMDLMAAVGIGDWVELGAIFPLILYQWGQPNPGTDQSVQNFAYGDLSVIAKAAIVRRLSYAKGFGLAGVVRVNAPTGEQSAFASDGSWTVSPTLVADYRFAGGILIALQAGVYYRPTIHIYNTELGPSFVGGFGGEIPLVRRWGITAVGGGYVNVDFFHPPMSLPQIPAELMLGLRWYASFGVTFTTGLNFGAACAIGVPAFRFFISAIWVPGHTNEQSAIDDFKKPPDDPDGDGVIGEADLCPNEPGPVWNNGCPDRDTDHDGIPDRLDDCPNLPGRREYNGCPRVYAKENKIKVLETVHFATDQDIILPESF
jgi:hypothetical protein